MRFIRLETRGRETADKRTRDAPVQGTSLLLWTFVRGSGRRTASLPVWRLGCFRRRRFVCGPINRGKDRGARASRRPQPWGIRCRTRRQDAAPGVKKSRGQSLRSFVETLPRRKRARGGPLRAGVSGPFSPPRCREGTDSAAGRDTSSSGLFGSGLEDQALEPEEQCLRITPAACGQTGLAAEMFQILPQIPALFHGHLRQEDALAHA